MSFDPKLLACFVAVAETMSFSKAAENLRMAQSWVSRQVRKLETQIGFDLFDRSTRQVELTSRGRRLFERAQLAISHTNATMALAKTLAREGEVTRLGLGVAPYGLFVPQRTALIDRFMSMQPKARVEIEIGVGDRLVPDLRQGRLDAAFLIEVPALTGSADLESIVICEGGIDVVMPKDDPLARLNTIGRNDVAGRTMATFPRATHTELFDAVFGAFEPAGVTLAEVSDYSFFMRLAERDQITAMPAWQPLPVGGLVRRRFKGAHPVRFQVTRCRANGSPLLDAFWRLASEAGSPAP